MVLLLVSRCYQSCGDKPFPSFNHVNSIEMAENYKHCSVLDFVG